MFLGIVLSCLTLFEASVLTWHPAGVVHATCMREGPISKPGGAVRGLLAAGTVFESMRACFYEFGQIYMIFFPDWFHNYFRHNSIHEKNTRF